MSKKNLAKSTIEGGRVNSNKWERKNSHNQERRSARDFCQKVMVDPESADDEEIKPKNKVCKEFSDKLNPMFRWLKSKVGQPWSEVRSEIVSKFDSRTTAGRHILYDHLFSSVIDTQTGFNKYGYIVDPSIEIIDKNDQSYRRAYEEFYVNQDGILCQVDKEKHKYERINQVDYVETSDWLNGRMIVEHGGVFSWKCPMDGLWKASWFDPNGYPTDCYKFTLNYYLFDNGLHKIHNYNNWDDSPTFTGRIHSDYWNLIENPFSFRQRGKLTEEEIKHFNSLKTKIKKEILDYCK